MTKMTGTFQAADDAGRRYEILIYTSLNDTDSFVGRDAEVLHELWTREGFAVRRRQQGEYEIRATGRVLRASSPEAP